MQVIIKPHHLRGNSWSHKDNIEKRFCPLQEALTEMGMDTNVGAMGVWSKGNNTNYLIPTDKWNDTTVSQYVKAADEGSEESVVLELDEMMF